MSKIYSVSEITGEIKSILESEFSIVSIEGEISNFRPSGFGHLYFTLKDSKSAIQAVMFKGRSNLLNFKPKDGMTVIAEGELSVYEQRGSYQIIIQKMTLAGQGDILKMLEDRKRKLAEEGLFDIARKKQLPFFPEKIAVITSPSGAAVRDIINIVMRRNNKISITVLPAVVQGEEAASALIRQLKIADLHNLGDIIIIGRGGGSLEDLLPFSDEGLVRAIAECKTPVISAVGHEIDWALSDYAADVRASTPSAAAELAAPNLNDIIYSLDMNREELVSSIESVVNKIKLLLNSFSPSELELKFRNIQQPFLSRFDNSKETILTSIKDLLKDFKHKIVLATNTLEVSNPDLILKRGYSIVTNESTGKTIYSEKDVKQGDVLTIKPADGKIIAKVES